MIPVPSGVRVWLATGHTDMRRGMNGLALQVQEALGRDPHAGDLYVFRGRRGDLVKVLWHDGLGLSLYAKLLERGRFLWPSPADGTVAITPAQLGYLLEGIVWTPPAGQVRSLVNVTPNRVRVCVRPVRAATAAGPDGLSAVRSFPFRLRAERACPLSGYISSRRSDWRSITLLRLALSKVTRVRHQTPIAGLCLRLG